MGKKKAVTALLLIFLSVACYAEAANRTISLIIDGKKVPVENGGLIHNNRVFVPIRVIAEGLDAEVDWEGTSSTVSVNRRNPGNLYLKGQDDDSPEPRGIKDRLMGARELKNILDDDRDDSLSDYRDGCNGGDRVDNDPLIVDLREHDEYNSAHIPGAVWIDGAENIAGEANIQVLRDKLAQHVANGGKNEIVLYCYTGNMSGLAAGVLGAQGLPVKNLMYGFDIGWRGTKTVDKPVRAPMENIHGKTIKCGG